MNKLSRAPLLLLSTREWTGKKTRAAATGAAKVFRNRLVGGTLSAESVVGSMTAEGRGAENPEAAQRGLDAARAGPEMNARRDNI